MNKIGNLFILGDSYSTFEDCIPQGYACYYKSAGDGQTDVNQLSQTWWHQFINETHANLILNNSYSGSTICNTGYGGRDYSNISFVGRLDKLINEGFFQEHKIDTCILFGGTNDEWAGSPMGELKYSGWTKEDLYSALPAVGYLLQRVKDNLKDSRIVFILNCDLAESITGGIKTACAKHGIEVIELQNVEKMKGHPSIVGMRQIKEQVTAYMLND